MILVHCENVNMKKKGEELMKTVKKLDGFDHTKLVFSNVISGKNLELKNIADGNKTSLSTIQYNKVLY